MALGIRFFRGMTCRACCGVSTVILDGDRLPQNDLVPLSNDGQEHEVEIDLG